MCLSTLGGAGGRGAVCCCDDPSQGILHFISQVSLGREGLPAEDSAFGLGPLGE